MNRYTLKKQVGGRGFFVDIIFEATVVSSSGSEITVDYQGEAQWETACKMGVLLFYDYYKVKLSGSLKVVIYDVNWFHVDTINLGVLFCVVKALCEHFQVHIASLDIEDANAIFNFPDFRSLS